MEVSGKIHAPTSLSPGKRPSAHLIGGRMDPRFGKENFLRAENPLPLPRFEPRTDQSLAGR